jgi:hypothetical protein
LVRAYAGIAARRNYTARLHVILRHRDAPQKPPAGCIAIPIGTPTEEEPQPEVLDALPVRDLPAWLDEPHAKTFGAALQLEGDDAFPLFEHEGGLHVLQHKGKASSCFVAAIEIPLKQYIAPQGIAKQGAIGTKPARRTYHLDTQAIKERSRETPYDALDAALAEWLAADLERKVWEAVDSWK